MSAPADPQRARPPVAISRLAQVLRDAALGRFPASDGAFEVVAPMPGGVEAVVALTGHALVATALPATRLERAGADGYGGASAPAVLTELAGPDGEVDVLDALLVRGGTGQTLLPERLDLDDHPRVRHARHWRSDVHVHGDERGLVTIGTGVGALPELSFEVETGRRGRGVGRALLADALGLVPEGEPVLACVAPGNAASLRAVLAVGFVPIGSVQLVRPGPARR
jgi:GNAT superfamily N-acetyltransferase